jgi:hypothetical protein
MFSANVEFFVRCPCYWWIFQGAGLIIIKASLHSIALHVNGHERGNESRQNRNGALMPIIGRKYYFGKGWRRLLIQDRYIT